MLKKILIITFLLTIITYAYSEPPLKVAVIPFNNIGVSQGDAFGFTLIFETALQQTGVFEIIEQRSVDELLSAQEYAAGNLTTSENAIEFGQLIAATQIILGTVGSIGEQYYLNIKRVDVETGKNLQAKNLIKDSIISLLTDTPDLVQSIAEEVAGKDSIIIQTEKRLVRKDTYSFIGKFLHYDLFEYDKNGRLILIHRYNAYNKYLHYTRISYFDNGLESRRSEWESVHKMIRYFSYEYNDMKQKKRAMIFLPNNKYEQYVLYTYDPKGRLIEETYYDFVGTKSNHSTYMYNNQGIELVCTNYDKMNRKLDYSVSKYEDVPAE